MGFILIVFILIIILLRLNQLMDHFFNVKMGNISLLSFSIFIGLIILFIKNMLW